VKPGDDSPRFPRSHHWNPGETTASRRIQCLSLGYTLFGFGDQLLQVSFQFLFSITTQFMLPFDYLTELEKPRSPELGQPWSETESETYARSTWVLFSERFQQKLLLALRSFAPDR
jgi:hypothetical protein